MSDKQKGLVDVINKIGQHSEKRFCAHHMYNNFKATHKGLALKNCIWSYGTTTSIPHFEAKIAKLKALDESA